MKSRFWYLKLVRGSRFESAKVKMLLCDFPVSDGLFLRAGFGF